MLIQKTGPVGIDALIQDMQTQMHDALLLKWSIATDDYKAYGRCDRNKTTNGYIAEYYIGSKEYKEVFWDDSLTMLSFYGTDAKVDYAQGETINIHQVFFINITKVKPSILHRGDEEVKADIISTVKQGAYALSLVGFEQYSENALREYPGSRRDKRLIAVDMQPMMCFRLNFKLLYDIDQNCKPFTNI